MERGQLPQLIKDLLIEHHLLSASQIITYLEEQGHKYNKTSIYRALDKMLEEAVVCRQQLVDHQMSYELRDDHDHLVCDKCGKIQQVDTIFSSPQKVNQFNVEHHHLTLYGVCHECQK